MESSITVHQLLERKGREVFWVAPEKSVRDALRVMAFENVGALLVMSEGRPVGILSERDYARKIVLQGKFSWNTSVGDVMTPLLASVSPEDSIEECMRLITHRRMRHLPVIVNGEVIGMVSIGDVVNALLSEQEFVIQQLEQYITG